MTEIENATRALFDGFANVWTPVALSGELANGTFSTRVAGTPVVLFRDLQHRPVALVDQCPHRGVALSLGKVRDGCIECPFHGWRFDSSGTATHIPWNPDAKLSALRAVSIPVREIAGQIWIYTAAVEHPPSEPAVLERLLQPGIRISGVRCEWRTHWTRAMENMLDWPHLPFVHAATIGKSMKARVGGRMDVSWEATPWGARSHIEIDGANEPGALDLRWPNQMNLHIPIPNKTLLMLVACVPVDASRTTMLLAMARDFMKSPLLDWAFHRTNLKIATEDRAIVESSHPPEVPPAGEERSVRTDALPLHFRKRYYAELRSGR